MESTTPPTGSLLSELPQTLDKELIEILQQHGTLRIERIVSTGQCSPPGFWYDQAEHEWVLLVSGEARIELESGSIIQLAAGDYLHLPAHQKHRVQWTSDREPTVWLAIFYQDQDQAP